MIDAILNMNWLELIGAVTLLLNGCLAVALVIPGEQPDNALQAAVNFISKFSRK